MSEDEEVVAEDINVESSEVGTPLEVKIVAEKEKVVNEDLDYEDFEVTDEEIEESNARKT